MQRLALASARPWSVPVGVGVLVLAGLLLRLALMDDSFFGDEVSTYFVVRDHDLGGVLELVRSEQEQTPPLFFVLAWLAGELNTDSSLLRLPSLLAGVALIPVVYLLGARTAGRAAGLLAAALVTFSPFLIFYATEARAYAVMTLCASLAALGLVAGLQTGGRRWWALYAVASCLAMYTHYTAVFVLAALALWALVACRAQWRWIAGANAAAAVAFLPWLGEYRADDADGAAELIAKLHPLTWDNATTDLAKIFAGVPFQELGITPGRIILLVIGAGVLVAAAGYAMARRAGDEPPRPLRWTGLLLVGALAAPVLGGIVSLLGPSIFSSRNLITAAPMALLLAATLAVGARGLWRTAAVVLLLGGFVAGGLQLLGRDAHRPDVDGPLAHVDRLGSPGDPVVQATSQGPGVLQPVEIAAEDRGLDEHPVIRLGSPEIAADAARRAAGGPGQYTQFLIGRPSPQERAAQAVAAARNGTIWIVASGAGPELLRPAADSLLTQFTAALPAGWRVVDRRTYAGLGPTTLIELRGPAPS